MGDPPIPISSTPGVEPEAVAKREFPTARRGYDPHAVRGFLSDVAQQLRSLRSRHSELEARLADAEQRASAPPIIDEETVSAVVGAETARILHAAHAAAADVLAKAEVRAADILAEAETSAREHRHRVETEAAGVVGEARQAAAAAIETAKDEGRTMIEEARELRRRVLADLADRRRTLTTQIEQLRAGKDTLSSAVAHVAATIADVRSRLDDSEEDARAAADTARRRTAVEQHESPDAGGGEPESAPSDVAGRAGGNGAVAEGLEGEDTSPPQSRHDLDSEEHDPAHVGELFAKLRASAPTVEAPRPHRSRRHRPAPESETAVESGDGAPEMATESLLETADEDSFASSVRAEALIRRDELIAAPLGTVTHSLKRALRVEQNELLHRLRSLSNGKDPSDAIAVQELKKNLAEATIGGLLQAYEGGFRFAEEWIASSSGAPDAIAAHAAAEAVASELGGEITAVLGRQLGDGLRAAIADGGSQQHAVGAAFRDWKGERVEDVAGDRVASAFSAGVLESAKRAGRTVSWIFDDGPTRCSDCEDDELAGEVVAGAAFPTGQSHPPAHGGCRCLLAPSRLAR